MAENPKTVVVRPDVDIDEDIDHMLTRPGFEAVRHDRARMEIAVTNGAVTITGHTRTAQTPDVLSREVAKIPGVKSVDVSQLYNDDALRVLSGQMTPVEVFTAVSYGAVVLTGKIPAGMTLEEIVAKVEAIEGVRKVIPNFK
ncbi:MAG: BON domain-containing protein [Chloroflexota bacterium]